jgi:biopolymer transport protein ExbD
MSMAVGPNRGIKSDINVTPLVDVCLVLLIIFMVVTPMLQKGKDVNLPKAHKIDAEGKESEPLIVSITRDHKIWLDKNQVTDQQLQDGIAAQGDKHVLLKGDASLSYGDVRRVLKIAEAAKARGVELAVEELKDK